MRTLSALLFAFALLSCSNQKTASVLNTDVLPTQTFRINTARDTVVKTAGGALLKIDKGSLTGNEVELQVKEAYSFEEIVKAGLTTQSNGQALSSGGMIYLKAVDRNVAILKPLKVSLPTKSFDAGMNVYKGEANDGEINWADPEPLADSLPLHIKTGKAIFTTQCATCHALDKVLTGPALRGTEHRGPWNERQNLFAFTRNAGAFIPLTNYTECLAAEFSGQIMPGFPQLPDDELNSVYDYIKYGEIKNGLRYYRNPCDDSCRRYDSIQLVVAMQRLKRERLVKDNGSMTNVFYDSRPLLSIRTEDTVVSAGEDKYVTMEDNNADYYKFTIEAFGWYNVDRLMKGDEDFKESGLTVTLQGEQKSHVDIYLAIPSLKVFTKAGRTGNAGEFAFDTKDGKLPLPQGAKAYVFAVSEREDGILFAYKEFITSLSQNIPVAVEPSTKEKVYALFDSLKFSDLSVKVEDSKNATEVRSADKNIKVLQGEAEKLRPKNCDCFCQSDTTAEAPTMEIIQADK